MLSLIACLANDRSEAHFAQISYVRQRIHFTQVLDEAMRGVD